MSKNGIFTSPLGIGLGIGLGTAVGAAVIGVVGFSVFKYMGENDEKSRGSFDSQTRSSMFSLEDNDFNRNSSFSENPIEHTYSEPRPIPKPDLTKHTKVLTKGKPNTVGGKHSKKRNRKKKRNTIKNK